MVSKRVAVASTMTVGALAATAIGAVLVRRERKRLPAEYAAAVRELAQRITDAQANPAVSAEADRLQKMLRKLETPGVGWHLGASKTEVLQHFLADLLKRKLTDEQLIGLEQKLDEISALADENGI